MNYIKKPVHDDPVPRRKNKVIMSTNVLTFPAIGENSIKTHAKPVKIDISNGILQRIFNTDFDFSQPSIRAITPQIAEELLKTNTHNRPIRQRHVAWLSKQMELGFWHFTGNSIKIDKDGHLCDGQHTLHAIIKSQTSQQFVVIGGLDKEAMHVLDTGISRGAGDVLQLNGFTNGNRLAAIARKVLVYKQGEITRALGGIGGSAKDARKQSDNVVANITILEEVVKNKMIAESSEVASKLYSHSRILPHTSYAIFYYIFAEKDPSDAWEFLCKLATGVELSANSPIYLLRMKLEQEMAGRVRFTSQLKSYYIIYCWNKFRSGESPKILQTPSVATIPEII